MKFTQKASSSLLDYNEAVMRKAALTSGGGGGGLGNVVRPVSAVPLFVSRGEYLEKTNVRPPSAGYAGLMHGGEKHGGMDDVIIGSGNDRLA